MRGATVVLLLPSQLPPAPLIGISSDTAAASEMKWVYAPNAIGYASCNGERRRRARCVRVLACARARVCVRGRNGGKGSRASYRDALSSPGLHRALALIAALSSASVRVGAERNRPGLSRTSIGVDQTRVINDLRRRLRARYASQLRAPQSGRPRTRRRIKRRCEWNEGKKKEKRKRERRLAKEVLLIYNRTGCKCERRNVLLICTPRKRLTISL